MLNRSKKTYFQERAALRLRNSEGVLTDSALIQACLGGDAGAWDALIERYEGFIYAQVLRCGLPAAEAADVFQEVCLRLFHHLHELRDISRLAGWLASTARREAWRQSKKNAHSLSLDSYEMPIDTESDQGMNSSRRCNPELSALAEADRTAVWQAMDALPGPCRRLLILLYCDDTSPSYQQISEILKLPAGSIGPTRARCLKKLQKFLLDQGFGEG